MVHSGGRSLFGLPAAYIFYAGGTRVKKKRIALHGSQGNALAGKCYY